MEWLPPYPSDNFCLKIVAFNLLDGKDGRHDHRYNDRDRFGQKRFPGARSLDDGAVKIPKNAIETTISQVHGRTPCDDRGYPAWRAVHIAQLWWAMRDSDENYVHSIVLYVPPK